jgi:hypothetical protein
MTDKQRIRQLELALRPFAREANNWSDKVPDRYRPGQTEPKQRLANPGSRAVFNIGHLRRAQRLLER